MIKRLNERARIKVITPVGETDFFELENIVRQGTVYGPQICIAVMDRINFTGNFNFLVFNLVRHISILFYLF